MGPSDDDADLCLSARLPEVDAGFDDGGQRCLIPLSNHRLVHHGGASHGADHPVASWDYAALALPLQSGAAIAR